MAIPHNSKCRYGERGAADAKPKAQIILDAAKVSAASGGNSEPKQGQRSQSARGFCPRSTMRVPQPDIIEYFGNADAVPQPPERCLSRKAGIVRYCLRNPPVLLSIQNDFPQSLQIVLIRMGRGHGQSSQSERQCLPDAPAVSSFSYNDPVPTAAFLPWHIYSPNTELLGPTDCLTCSRIF